jgi:hypothetical protein
VPDVKLIFETCGRCGGQVVGDNLGTGRPWQHIDRPDDHPIIFGTPAPPMELRRATLDELEDAVKEFPPPGTPREPTPDEIPGGANRMLKVATEAGFETTVRLCRGPIKMAEHHDPRGFRFVESLLVGFRHADGRIAIAVWERQETESAFKYQWAMFPGGGGLAGSVTLKDYLKQPPL